MAGEIPLAPSIGFGPLQTGLQSLARGLGGAVERWLEAERDQLALWLPVGLGLGIAAWFVLPDPAGWAGFALGATGIAGFAFVLGQGGRLGRALGLFALAAALGCALVWLRADRVAAPRLDRPRVSSFEARIEAVDRLPAQGAIRLRLAPLGSAGLPPLVRVNVAEEDAPPGLLPGARIALRARLMPPPPAAVPGAYDFARVAWFQRLGATGRSLDKVRIVAPPAQVGLVGWIAGLRSRLTAHIHDRLAGTEGGVAAAFVTGDQGAIPEEDAEAMRRSGLAHLLSVSGLHVTAVVAGTMLLLMRLLALSPRLALHATLPLIAAGGGAIAGIAYTLIAGAEVPTVRSCIAALLVLLGIAMGREAMTLRLVAAGALVVLVFWPEALAGPSFQLSFAAVTAIVALHEHPHLRALFARREESWGAKLGRTLLSLLLTGLAVEAALAPIALFHFHKAGLYGALANIVAIPLTTFVIMPLEALGLLFDVAGIGGPFWWLAGQAIAVLLWVAHRVAESPGAVAALPSMPWSAFALMLAGGLWLALWRTRIRRFGLVPLGIGALWALATPPPDLLVTGDGRHLAIRTREGIALLRPKAGDYIRDTLGEASGAQGEPAELDALPTARCNRDLCVAELMQDGRRWRVLATRSPYFVDIAAMNRACAAADIVISDRRLPRTCRPRWLKVDRPFLARTGGLAIDLANRRVRTVAEGVGGHPWAQKGWLNSASTYHPHSGATGEVDPETSSVDGCPARPATADSLSCGACWTSRANFGNGPIFVELILFDEHTLRHMPLSGDFPDHRKSQRSLPFQYLGGARFADQFGEVCAAFPLMRHGRLDRFHRVKFLDGPAAILIGFNKGDQNVEAVAFGSSLGSGPQRLDLAKRRPMIILIPDGMDIHGNLLEQVHGQRVDLVILGMGTDKFDEGHLPGKIERHDQAVVTPRHFITDALPVQCLRL